MELYNRFCKSGPLGSRVEVTNILMADGVRRGSVEVRNDHYHYRRPLLDSDATTMNPRWVSKPNSLLYAVLMHHWMSFMSDRISIPVVGMHCNIASCNAHFKPYYLSIQLPVVTANSLLSPVFMSESNFFLISILLLIQMCRRNCALFLLFSCTVAQMMCGGHKSRFVDTHCRPSCCTTVLLTHVRHHDRLRFQSNDRYIVRV